MSNLNKIIKKCLSATVKNDNDLFYVNEKVVDIFAKDNKDVVINILTEVVNEANSKNIDIHSLTFDDLSKKLNLNKIIESKKS
jgi:hypothetical protein